jgi:hypothetical protein
VNETRYTRPAKLPSALISYELPMHVIPFLIIMLVSALAMGVFIRISGGSWGQTTAMVVGTMVFLQFLYLALIFYLTWLKSHRKSEPVRDNQNAVTRSGA